MHNNRTLPPLRVVPRRSRQLLLVLGAAHGAAAAAVLVSVPQTLACVLVLVALLWSGIHSIRRHGLRRGRWVACELQLSGERDCRLRFAADDAIDCAVADSSYVSTCLVVLHLRAPGQRRMHHVVLLPDSLDADTFRRLRARLRWTRAGASEEVERKASL